MFSQKEKLVIYGAGGHGREVAEIIKEINSIEPKYEVLGFIDDKPLTPSEKVNDLKILGGIEWVEKALKENQNFKCICAVGESSIRKKLVRKLETIGVEFCTIIHPSVKLNQTVKLGTGVIIFAGTTLTCNITIGDHVNINLACTISHDSVIGDYCTINPNASLNGNVHINEGVYVGSGVTIIQEVTVGEWAIIGAGATVISDIPPGVIALGVPAKPIRHQS
ncbi:MAG: acetyltransferase [Candidatus Hodarchaeales archaeon]